MLLLRGNFVSGPGGQFGMCFGQAKWSGIMLEVREVGDKLYRMGYKCSFIHVSDPTQWTSYGHTPCSPLKLQIENTGVFDNRVAFRRDDVGTNLLKARLSTAESIKSFSFADLQYLGDYYACTGINSRVGYLTALARKACEGEWGGQYRRLC